MPSYNVYRKDGDKWKHLSLYGSFKSKKAAWHELSVGKKEMLRNPLTSKKAVRKMLKRSNFKVVKRS